MPDERPARYGRAMRILLPGIILQSVLIGGGYATGREIVEYGGKYGARGWISGLAIFLGFTVISILSIESCRRWRVYDYRSLLRKLVGRWWIAFEISYLIAAILVIAVMASAAGEILHEALGLNEWIGILAMTLLVGFLNYKGDDVIARLETIGTVALFAGYLLFSVSVFWKKGNAIADVLAKGTSNFTGETPGFLLLIWTGILYVGYNLAIYPASFFAYRGIRSKYESILAGLASGLLMTIPWFLTYFSMLAYYPDSYILDAAVPWMKMLQDFDRAYIIIFGLVVGWTLVETATGMIHAFINRIEIEVRERASIEMKKTHKAIISTLALIASLLLSRVGIIDLVAKGYTMLAYAMIAFYALPILLQARRLWSAKTE